MRYFIWRQKPSSWIVVGHRVGRIFLASFMLGIVSCKKGLVLNQGCSYFVGRMLALRKHKATETSARIRERNTYLLLLLIRKSNK